MSELSNDWLTEGLIDFEYKKYMLLAYLKKIRKEFGNTHLYPSLAELIFHHNNLQRVRNNKDLIYEKFPKNIDRADFEKLKLTYRKALADADVIKELGDIIRFAMPRFQEAIEEGKEIYEFVEEQMEFEPVGIIPMYLDEGYLLINQDRRRDVLVYKYQTSVFESSREKYRGINIEFVANDFTDITRPVERVKMDLSRQNSDLPNPATYVVTYKLGFPHKSTVLPVAKRLLMRHLSQAA